MTVALNSRPRAILHGVQDQTPDELTATIDSLPTHLPHIWIYAEEGEIYPQLLVGDERIRAYGSKTFELDSKFANHQTVLANIVNGNGNAAIYQRIQPTDAPDPATMRLCADVLADQVPTYVRDTAGRIVLGANGLPQPTGDTVPGYRIKFVKLPATDFAEATKLVGTQTTTGGAQSVLYPICDSKVASFGEHGNNKGYRMWAPVGNNYGVNTEAVSENAAFIFRMQQIKRSDNRSQPSEVLTARGAEYVDFAFKPDAVISRTKQRLFASEVVQDAYVNPNVKPETTGNFSDIHFYTDFIAELVGLLYDAEKAFHLDWPTETDEGKYLINFLSARDIDDVPYNAIVLADLGNDGISLTQYSNHYCQGGGDGTMSNALFAESVKFHLSNYIDSPFNYLDSAALPFSIYYDTGFPMDTKYALMRPVGARKDVMAIVCTQDIDAPQNDLDAEASALAALRAYARNFVESELFGTPACRIAIMGHSGYLTDNSYKGLLPLTIELADMFSKYMGAGTGEWDDANRFDESPGNVIGLFKKVNLTYKRETAANSDWDLGLIGVQTFDHNKRLFIPAFQSVYEDKRSALNDLVNVFVFTEMEKVAERNWRRMSGGHSRMTPEEFITKSNNDILTDIRDGARFDDRYIIEVNTYFTDEDVSLGYSYSADIVVYTNDRRYVGSYTIIARDRAQLAAAA